MKTAHILGSNVNDGSSQWKIWIPEMQDLARRISTGTVTEQDLIAIPADQVLRIDKLINGRVPEVLGWSAGPFIVAPAIRDFLDRHEPGVHRFIPVRIVTAKPHDGRTEHGTHWILMLPPLIDCLVFEETVFTKDYQGTPWPRKRTENSVWGGGIPSGVDTPCTLDGRDLQGRHLWQVATTSYGRGEYTCSPAFWDFFKSNKMLGWEIDKTCIVKN